MRHTVRISPSLYIRPSPRRWLAERDGYLLAHYEAWKDGSSSDIQTFELRATGELFIHQLGGDGDYQISLAEGEALNTYRISVYYRQGEPTTWLEFFVDTPERIPSVVQLGVRWE